MIKKRDAAKIALVGALGVATLDGGKRLVDDGKHRIGGGRNIIGNAERAAGYGVDMVGLGISGFAGLMAAILRKQRNQPLPSSELNSRMCTRMLDLFKNSSPEEIRSIENSARNAWENLWTDWQQHHDDSALRDSTIVSDCETALAIAQTRYLKSMEILKNEPTAAVKAASLRLQMAYILTDTETPPAVRERKITALGKGMTR